MSIKHVNLVAFQSQEKVKLFNPVKKDLYSQADLYNI